MKQNSYNLHASIGQDLGQFDYSRQHIADNPGTVTRRNDRAAGRKAANASNCVALAKGFRSNPCATAA